MGCAQTYNTQQGDMEMMLDWNEYQKELGSRIGELAKLSPDTVRGYQTLSAANSKTGKLDEKTRQLISLAVAITTRCDGCITFHSEAALKAGATKEEISEALGVAVAMNAGAALVYSTRVLAAVLLAGRAPCVATTCFVKSTVNASILEVLSVVSSTPSDSQRSESLSTVRRKKPYNVLL